MIYLIYQMSWGNNTKKIIKKVIKKCWQVNTFVVYLIYQMSWEVNTKMLIKQHKKCWHHNTFMI